ncbi:hypothetical protein GCM10011533_20220 [Streptosporangium jomthongense]|uniref:Uncharacterized protein n=1 Tax=Marinobacter aromaticivorans TaxID=1494078 RepID=A0ABW2IVT2_9GAMM|nr:hypothetical protein [Marinobacter aromaticivorans]GGE67826.1 hypothetical protein GCM10011533_20220 [Streptosporangium jomthongense]
MANESENRRDGVWAQQYELAIGQTQHHKLGHVRLWITLLEKEWQVRSETREPETDPVGWTESIGHQLPQANVSLQRFVREGESSAVTFIPAVATLPTVIRPYHPLTIPGGTRCTIYVGTMVWMKICVGAKQTLLTEIPLAVPSLTWVGRNTMEGELCYSSSSFGRLVLEALPKRAWRATTPVTIINRRTEPLLLERFSLPTPLLSLHQNERGQLWTPGVVVEVATDMNSASLHMDEGLLVAAGPCRQVAPAREKAAKGRLVRAIDRVFG